MDFTGKYRDLTTWIWTQLEQRKPNSNIGVLAMILPTFGANNQRRRLGPVEVRRFQRHGPTLLCFLKCVANSHREYPGAKTSCNHYHIRQCLIRAAVVPCTFNFLKDYVGCYNVSSRASWKRRPKNVIAPPQNPPETHQCCNQDLRSKWGVGAVTWNDVVYRT